MYFWTKYAIRNFKMHLRELKISKWEGGGGGGGGGGGHLPNATPTLQVPTSTLKFCENTGFIIWPKIYRKCLLICNIIKHLKKVSQKHFENKNLCILYIVKDILPLKGLSEFIVFSSLWIKYEVPVWYPSNLPVGN